MEVCLSLCATENIFDGDIHAVFDLAEQADKMGVDQISTSDHIGFNRAAHAERLVTDNFPWALEQPWYEAFSVLTAIALRTKRARLSAYVLIAPLRGPAYLAKQLATLDVLSGGRVAIGLGVGWQKAEYDACGVEFQGRFGYLVELVSACRALWGSAPASFTGKRVHFEDFYSLPLPVQRDRLPVYFGLPPSPANCARIAQVADGWSVRPLPLPEFATGVRDIRTAFEAAGRDPSKLHVEVMILPVKRDDGSVDYEATRTSLRPWVAAGATMLAGVPTTFCRKPEELDGFLEFLVSLKDLQP